MCVSLSLNLNVSTCRPFLSENYSRFLAQSEQSLPSRSWCNMLATTPRGRKVNFEEVKVSEFLIKLKVSSLILEEVEFLNLFQKKWNHL